MASVIFNTPYLSHSASISPTIVTKSPIYASLPVSQISCSRTLTIHFGSTPFSNWNGLRKNGFSTSLRSFKLEKKRKCKEKSGVFASLFGVGAPEALVIGVVALLVFGPKGLADVAKNLGKTLRAFQPTIRELQEVSREFKSTLEKEIGLDELNNPIQGNYTSNTVKPPPTQIPPELSVTPPPPATTTQDSQATTTTTTTAPGGRPEDSQATTTTLGGSPEVSRETATAPGGSLDDSPETTVTPPLSNEDSQSTVDNTNGKKIYSSEELLKITEEQLKAVASQQQKDQPPSSTPESET